MTCEGDTVTDTTPLQGSADFHTTHWSLVRAAGRAGSPGARAALERLCAAYWYPLYAFARRSGVAAEDARDLVQGFFARFLAGNSLADLEPEDGRFRSYLLGALKHFLANERERARAEKRGGGVEPISLDLAGAEERYAIEPAALVTPESLFERRWALTVLERAMGKLRAEEEERGRGASFERLKGALAGEIPQGGYAVLARELGQSENALAVAVHRLRKRYRALVVGEVAPTVDRPQDVEDEIARLFRSLAG